MARIIGEVQPRYAFVENSPVLTSRGLGTVLGDLAALGFDARWGVISAADVGAPHLRERIWIVANAKGERYRSRGEARDIPCSDGRQNGQMRSVACGASDQFKNVAYRHSNSQSTGAINAGSLQKTNLDDSNGVGCGKPDILRKQQRGAEVIGAGEVVSDTNISQRQRNWREKPNKQENGAARGFGWWLTEPDVGRVANGVAARVDRLKAIGNGQVPAVAATAFRLLRGFP
jgi:DNA (cytosine-5)-methyltransferase 1